MFSDGILRPSHAGPHKMLGKPLRSTEGRVIARADPRSSIFFVAS